MTVTGASEVSDATAVTLSGPAKIVRWATP